MILRPLATADRAGPLETADDAAGAVARPRAVKTTLLKLHPNKGNNHAATMATKTTRTTGHAPVQPQKPLPVVLAIQASRLMTMSSSKSSRPSWPGTGALNNRPKKVMATTLNIAINGNQPALVTSNNSTIVSPVNKVCVALGYTGLAPSIVNECGIINISSVSLSPAEKSLLVKGLSFCPNTNYLDMGDAMRALDKFHRDLRLKYFFGNVEETDIEFTPPREGFEHKNFRRPSSWQPPRGPPTLEHFIAHNTMKANQLPSLRTTHKNLTRDEREAILSLSNNRHIIVKPADKGSGTVIMNTKDYIFEANRQLADTSFYAALDYDPTESFTLEINTFITKMFKDAEIGKRCFQYLLNTHSRPGRFYLLPKIHKNVLPPPGRPIISAIGSPTEKISEFLDHFLQPFLADMPSLVKDTGHFLYILSKLGPLPQNTILVTLDVTSLYTNVPLLQAKQAVGRVLNRTRPGATEPSNQSLIRLLDFVFTKNVFTFSDGNKLHYFVQTNGVSMGSKCAPSVACTYMGEFERQHVYTYHLQPFLWLRCVDDVFCLWNHGDAALQIFVDHLNSREGRIKFTCHSSTTSVEFLDTTVHIKDGVLNTELFIKPTNSLSYLERTSFHPKNTFTSLPYGEFVRARRNCSTAETFEIYSLKIKSAFQARGYDTSSLEEARLKACSLSRNNLFDAYKQIPDTATADASSQADNPTCMDNAPIHFINTFHPESHQK